MAYQTILTETRDRVALITLNRPQRLNALNDALADELGDALAGFDADAAIRCIVITGSDKAFAAGADIGAMAEWDYAKVLRATTTSRATGRRSAATRKPVIAAVAGYALGGGCELAMTCDIIIAADTAKFGQPEITIGTMPGFGGTQRLPRAVGKAKAMDWCLTGRMIDAAEAERAGLVARVVPADKLLGRGAGDRGEDRVVLAAGRDEDQGGGQPRVRDRRSRRGSCSSAANSMRRSRSTTRRKACARSSKSASPHSATGKCGMACAGATGTIGRDLRHFRRVPAVAGIGVPPPIPGTRSP